MSIRTSASDRAIDSTTVKHFTPFNTLDTELIDMLVANINVCHAPHGYLLFEVSDCSSDQYFLLSGKVKLTSSQGQVSSIEAGMPNSNQPLSKAYPRQHQAAADGDIEYFTINASVLDELNRSVKKPADYLSMLARTHPLDHGGNALMNLVQHELVRGNFMLPSIPDVALKIRQQIDKPDCSASDIVTLVSSDPAIAAKLIQAANSPIYRGVSNCDDITSAITRLGLITTKQLVTSFAILNLFKSESKLLKHHMEMLRRQSVAVASFSQALARQLQGFNAEEALLAGLLHTIGTLVVLCYADQFPELDDNELLLSVLVHRLSSTAGSMVLEDWGFSKEQITVARDSANWLRKNPQTIDYCDVIIIAKLCVLTGERAGEVLTQPSCIPVVNQLRQQISTDKITHIVDQAQTQIDELQNLFAA
jgi:HD-like signal output (HDOD) protein